MTWCGAQETLDYQSRWWDEVMSKIIKYIEDCLLARLQKRCDHPGEMVAADILEGCVDRLEVKYCRRCGAVKTDWSPHDPQHRYISLMHYWRRPDPHLWRG